MSITAYGVNDPEARKAWSNALAIAYGTADTMLPGIENCGPITSCACTTRKAGPRSPRG
jgi:hypothetical protein